MADLVVITPTRGRPDRFGEMVAAIRATAFTDVEVWVGFDDDDPSRYFGVGRELLGARDPMVRPVEGPRQSLVGYTNHLAAEALQGPRPPRYLATLGDDHRPRTPGWDRLLIDAIEQFGGPGIAYGNDLFQGERMPTAWVMSADAVRAVGWMMLPTVDHLYPDAAILELGRAAGRIVYRPDVVIEHLHPVAGKAAWDDSYRASNSQQRYASDRASFEQWRDGGGLAADIQRLLAAPAWTGG